MSRLEEIDNNAIKEKEHYINIQSSESGWVRTITLSEEDYNYILQKAQKTEELQAKVDELEKELNESIKRGMNVALDNVKYKQALEEVREKTKESVWHADIYIIVSKALKRVEG